MAAALAHGGSPDVQRPITKANNIFAIYFEDWGLSSSGQPRLIVALWEDGRIIWSTNESHGGGPYREGVVQPGTLDQFLARMEREGVFQDAKLSRAWFAADSEFTTIFLKRGRKRLQMRSEHEVAKTCCDCIPSTDAADYRSFRRVWDEIRSSSGKFLPDESMPVAGELANERGVISWREDSR
jgi:hypothetical protein